MTMNTAWQPSAAYLYVLHLDSAGLAWEYLRRNADYRTAWCHRGTTPDAALHWGLPFLEDPDLDARDACPAWRIGARPVVALVPHTDPAAQPLDLWAIPDRKTLIHDGERLWLYGRAGRELVTLTLAEDITNGEPFAYAMPAGVPLERYRFTLEIALSLLQGSDAYAPTALARPPRSAMTHMRALQALDGVSAGASQREIATVLFGETEVAARWSPDGELRAQVRYLIQRGRALVDGEYRTLLD